jgi:hypothetical protein
MLWMDLCHIPGMDKKRGTAWDGIRKVYRVYEAHETIAAVSRTSRDTFWEIRNVAMMIIAVAVVAGLFYLIG